MLKLVGTDGKRYFSWLLEPGNYVVGRKPECDFCILNKTISRQHARIEIDPGGETGYITDLQSHNGTLLNGAKLIDKKPIKVGDVVSFGDAEFRVTNASDPSSIGSKPTTARLSDQDPSNSVYLSINEALKPLPTKITEKPELLPVIFDMAKMLVLDEPEEVMLDRSLQMIAKVIPADRLAVLYVSDDQQNITTAATLLPEGKDPGAFNLSRTIVNEIFANKNAILIGDPTDDPRFAEQKSIIMSELKSAIAVPLFDEGKVLGILYADSTNPLHRYDDDHLRVLATFGNILASRLLNYSLLAARQERQIIEAELRRASSIQKKLLLVEYPEFPGYKIYPFQEPSRSVGGDLFDIRQLSNGNLLFMVADVSGKGMGAALLMSNILAQFRVLCDSDECHLLKMVEKVSQQLFHHSEFGDFATLFVGMIEKGTNKITFINAGHNPPLLVRKDGTFETLEPSGIMIGAFDFGDWSEKTVEMNPDDLIFIFTDGVTEAEREGSGQFGEKRMEELVLAHKDKAPEEIVKELMIEIDDFMGEAPRSDDITVMIVKRV